MDTKQFSVFLRIPAQQQVWNLDSFCIQNLKLRT